MSKQVTVAELPNCDFCSNPAEYDGKTKLGPWAYMCGGHFKEHGIGLGTGVGQKLVVEGNNVNRTT